MALIGCVGIPRWRCVSLHERDSALFILFSVYLISRFENVKVSSRGGPPSCCLLHVAFASLIGYPSDTG